MFTAKQDGNNKKQDMIHSHSVYVPFKLSIHTRLNIASFFILLDYLTLIVKLSSCSSLKSLDSTLKVRLNSETEGAELML